MKGEFYKMEYEAWDEAMEHLTLEQEACALRLIHQMYRRRGPVANHLPAIARLWRSHQNKARLILKVLLEDGIIQLTPEGHLTNTRVRRELDARETQRTHKVDAGKTGGRRSADARQTAAKKANEINETDQAAASTPPKQIQPEKRREEERRAEERREEKVIDLGSIDEPLPWEVERTEADPDKPATKTYAFVEGIIKLTEQDYQKLKRTYQGLNLDAELMGIAPWAADRAKEKGGNWYQPMIGALNKKLGKVQDQARQAKANAEAMAAKAVKHVPGQMAL